MAYFAELPKIYYDFNIGNTNKTIIIRDISACIRFQKDILSQITLYDDYDIKDGETPEILSEQIYGSPHYHWVIMLMNNVFDVINDWPLSSYQFQTYVDTKYGHLNLGLIHHYLNSDGFILDDVDEYYDLHTNFHSIQCEMTFNSNVIKSVTPNGFAELRPGNTNLQISGIGIDGAKIVKLLNIQDDSTLILTAPSTETIRSDITFVHIIDPKLNSSIVTNLDYETDLNDSKRRIKILHPTMLSSVVNQLTDLMNV